MQRAARWRRVVKWAYLGVALAALVLALASAKWLLAFFNGGPSTTFLVRVSPGALTVERRPAPGFAGSSRFPPGFSAWEQGPLEDVFKGWLWKVRWTGYSIAVPPVGYFYRLDIPLWIPFLLGGGAFVAHWHADRTRARLAATGACASCGYNRAGLVAGAACPECGALPKGAAAGGGTT